MLVLAQSAWLVVVLAATALLLADRSSDLPVLACRVAAVALTLALAVGLVWRTGGRPLVAVLLTAAAGVLALVTRWTPLLAGLSLLTGVLAAILAVMATTPAATFGRACREVLAACVIGFVGSVGVTGYAVGIDVDRLEYVVLAGALLGSIGLVYRLGAGLHGLGRRGYVVAGGAVVLLAVVLAYSEALGRWGSPELVGWVGDLRTSTRSALGAVPHPIEALLGFPALVWGVFMRARRRQGWWVCAFGVAATAPATTRLVDAAIPLRTTMLALGYSLVLGLLIGYVVIRIDQALTGTRGSRARRVEEATAHRPEPGRLYALN